MRFQGQEIQPESQYPGKLHACLHKTRIKRFQQKTHERVIITEKTEMYTYSIWMALWQIPHRIWPQRSTLSGMSGGFRPFHMNSSDQSHQQALPDLSMRLFISRRKTNNTILSVNGSFSITQPTSPIKPRFFRESLNYWNDYVTSKSAGESSQTKQAD